MCHRLKCQKSVIVALPAMLLCDQVQIYSFSLEVLWRALYMNKSLWKSEKSSPYFI